MESQIQLSQSSLQIPGTIFHEKIVVYVFLVLNKSEISFEL